MSNAETSLDQVGADGYVSAADVLFLRRNVFKDGLVSTGELDSLFTLAERAPDGDKEWPAFFEEAAADFYLREEQPQGYLTDEEFRSLEARVTRDGRKASPIELGLLIRLLESATSTPDAMTAFVGEQLKRMVLDRMTQKVTREDAVLFRRFIFAKGGGGNVAVTRREAELLFDINDAARRAGCDPSWTEFFIRAIANHLMAHFTYAPPSRDEAVRRQAFVADHSVNVAGFFKRMIAGGLSGLRSGEKSAQAERNENRERDAAIAQHVTGSEADWLADRIGADGHLHDTERALVDHLRELGADLPPKLKALVDRAA